MSVAKIITDKVKRDHKHERMQPGSEEFLEVHQKLDWKWRVKWAKLCQPRQTVHTRNPSTKDAEIGGLGVQAWWG